MWKPASVVRPLCLIVVCLLCGCGDGPTPPPPPLSIQKAPTNSGDQQTDTVLATLAPFRVLVQRGTAAVQGVGVLWTSVSDSGLTGQTTTDASGIASVSLTFDKVGTHTVHAAVTDAVGSPVTFTATTTPGQAGPHVTSITVTPDSGALLVFAPADSSNPGALQLTASLRDSGGATVTGRRVVWSSSNASVAAVDSSGQVSAVAPGKATITGAVDAVHGSASIRVLRARVDPATFTMLPGDQVSVHAYVTDSGGQGDWVTSWASASNAVRVEPKECHWIVVGPSGERCLDYEALAWVTALAGGRAVVRASIWGPQGGAAYLRGTAFVRITVPTGGPVARVLVKPDTVRTVPGGAVLLDATLLDAAGDTTYATTSAPVSWSSPTTGLTFSPGPNALHETQVAVGDRTGSLAVIATARGRSDTVMVISDYITITAVAQGCVLTADGKVYCVPALGTGLIGYSNGPAAVTGGLTFTAVTHPDGYARGCALATRGSAYCWGNDYGITNGVGGTVSGLLGTGGVGLERCWVGPLWGWMSCSSRPVAVAGGHSFVQITGAALHTCALTPQGTAWCWGYNAGGQLGDGTTINRAIPVPVAGGLTFAQIDAAGEATCALTKTGAAYCWGYQRNGATIASPEAVKGGLTFTRLTHGCALATDGAAFCVEPGADGLAAVAMAPGFTFTDIGVASHYFLCGLTAAGAVYCWGTLYDDFGGATVVEPTALGGGLTFTSLSAYGSDNMCGITTAGVAYCWELGGSSNKLWGQR